VRALSPQLKRLSGAKWLASSRVGNALARASHRSETEAKTRTNACPSETREEGELSEEKKKKEGDGERRYRSRNVIA